MQNYSTSDFESFSTVFTKFDKEETTSLLFNFLFPWLLNESKHFLVSYISLSCKLSACCKWVFFLFICKYSLYIKDIFLLLLLLQLFFLVYSVAFTFFSSKKILFVSVNSVMLPFSSVISSLPFTLLKFFFRYHICVYIYICYSDF